MSGFQNVHIRVSDAETNKPTPVRIRFVGSDGKYYAPFGRLTQFTGVGAEVGGNVMVDGKEYAYIDGACEIRLPVGPVQVEIHKGPEYLPVFETVNLTQGKLAMRFEIRRWIHMREQGWYSGDTHCFEMSPHAALLEAGGEDLAVVNLLARYGPGPSNAPGTIPTSNNISNILAFSGQKPCLDLSGHRVAVNTFNAHSAGALALLNCHRPVFPLTFEFTDKEDSWNLTDWCEQCHRKGGLVVAPNPFKELPCNEYMADFVLQQIDTIGIVPSSTDSSTLSDWFELLNSGFKVPLSAGSGKASNHSRLGEMRTYARIEGECTYKNWIEAVRAGRTFVSAGPMLTLTVDDCGPGETVNRNGKTVAIVAEVRSLTPVDRLQVAFCGRVVHEVLVEKNQDEYRGTLRLDYPVESSGWLLARCQGAVTSPVYIHVDNQPMRPNKNSVEFLQREITHERDVVRRSKFKDEIQRQRSLSVYDQALEELKKRLS